MYMNHDALYFENCYSLTRLRVVKAEKMSIEEKERVQHASETVEQTEERLRKRRIQDRAKRALKQLNKDRPVWKEQGTIEVKDYLQKQLKIDGFRAYQSKRLSDS